MTARAEGTPARTARRADLLRSPVLPLVLLVVVLGLDALRTAVRLDLLLDGVTDELAHLATAGLVLLAAVRPAVLERHAVLVVTALASAVLVDVDHVPLLTGVPEVAAGGRPFSHSLLTVGLLLAAGRLVRPWRPGLTGAGLGVGLHLVRDAATGPGLPLWWPLTADDVRLPHALLLALVTALAATAVLRRRREARA